MAETLQNPTLVSRLMPQPEEIHDRKRRLLRNNYAYNEINPQDSHTVNPQVLSGESLNVASLLVFNNELLEKLESSLMFWENILRNVVESYVQNNSSLELDES